jgi:DNA-binding transcriptional regulator YiaG
MSLRRNLDTYLNQRFENANERRPFTARLDKSIRRAKLTSYAVARALDVSESDVTLWRAGVTLPSGMHCRRLSELLQIDIGWLCAESSR